MEVHDAEKLQRKVMNRALKYQKFATLVPIKMNEALGALAALYNEKGKNEE